MKTHERPSKIPPLRTADKAAGGGRRQTQAIRDRFAGPANPARRLRANGHGGPRRTAPGCPTGPVASLDMATGQFSTSNERDALGGFLDKQRAGLLRKTEGASDADALLTPTVSSLSLLGLLKHSALRERRWFQVIVAGWVFPGEWPETAEEGWFDEDFRVDERDTVKHWTAYFEEQAAISREIAAGLPLDTPCAYPDHSDRICAGSCTT
ncbi:DUF664 domain-containing protein [Streptomyces sp. ITFR-6]|nr:DUF664 domain-containing protein [Streptomyces sp. ITFR-6]WNI30766.1 DUF664 domain-containing protein [Streptomyces sp. ITFR-6]